MTPSQITGRVLCIQPHNGIIVPAALEAGVMHHGMERFPELEFVYYRPPANALHCNGFNIGVCEARNRDCTYFAMLHADLVPDHGWLAQLISDLEEFELDIIHAPAAIKDSRGLTSTALGFNMQDWWQHKRKMTLREMGQLPEVFALEDVQRQLAPDAVALLPNTGCLVMRCNDWFKNWQGFGTWDRVRECQDGMVRTDVIPEDWLMGFEATEAGLKIGVSRRVCTRHYGTSVYNSGELWGDETDLDYIKRCKREAEYAQ